MDRRGFSLMEAMVVVGIFGIIGAAIVAASGAGHQFWAVGDAADQVQMEFRRGMGYLEEDIKEGSAKRVCNEQTYGQSACGAGKTLPTGSPGSIGITFKVPVDLADGSNNGVLDINGKCCDWGTKNSTTKNIRYVRDTTQSAMDGQLVRCVVADGSAGTPGCPINSIGSCSMPGFEDCLVTANRVAGIEFWKTGNLVTVKLTTRKKARTSGTGSDAGWEPALANIRAQINLRNP